MKIRNRFTNEVIFSAEAATLKDLVGIALKEGRSLTRANLAGADLACADLTRADLAGANLIGADLAGANLAGANIAGADLAGANGIQPERCTPLLMLLDQPGEIHAYKMVTNEGLSPMAKQNGGTPINYEIGKEYEVLDACTDINQQCAVGISLATLDWCLKNWEDGYRVFIVEFKAKDIAAIPTATDGKFRVFRCKVVGEKDISKLVSPRKEKDQ